MNKLHDIFACPICKNKLLEQFCVSCNISFSNDVVPSYICKEMYSSEQSYIDSKRVIDFWGNGWSKRLEESDHKFLYALDVNGLIEYADECLEFCKSTKSLMAEVPVQNLSDAIVLNIGCGAGTEALILSRGGAYCIAMDITSPAAIASDFLLCKLGRGIGIQGDARFIPLESDSVDVVYSSGVLHHSTDLPKSIAEIRRVLKPGGIAFIMLYATWSITFIQEKIFHWAGENAWNTESRKNPCTTTYSVDECKALFSGFESVNINKRNASLRNFAKIGKFLPTIFDEYINEPLGANLNIVAKKPMQSQFN